ncbi:MAG: hypothetical protein ACI4F0_08680 [Agathobacter sp.]
MGERKTTVHTQKAAGARRESHEREGNWVWEGRKPLSTPKKPSAHTQLKNSQDENDFLE